MKKRNKITLLCIILVLVVLATSVLMVGCDDKKEKKEAVISADSQQTFEYDGQVHNVVATLNHEEAQLTYSPAQGYSEVGEYEITVSAPETKNYKATSKKITLEITKPREKSTSQLWKEFTEELKKSFAVEGKDKLKVNIQAMASVKNGGKTTDYALDVMGNIDLSNTVNNSSLFHIVLSADSNNIGIYYQDGAMYLEAVDQIFKIKNSDITKFIAGKDINLPTDDKDDSSIIDGILAILPIVLFRDKQDIKCTDGIYELTVDLPHVWSIVNSDLISGFIKDIISKENMDIIDKFFAANEMQFKFAVDLSKESNPLANVTVDNGKAYLGAFEIAGGSYDYVSGKLDADKIQSAEEINLANAVVNGTIELVDRTGKTYEHLSYKLVADLDVFALISAIQEDPANWMNNEEVKKSKLYFSLYHVHTPGENGVVCTDSMCPTRVGGMEDTTLLDIAFDPTNFGNGKIYLAANLSRIFSDASFSATLGNILSLASMLAGTVKDVKTQNFLTSIDLGVLLGATAEEPGDPEDPGDDGFKFDTSMINPLVSIITTCVNLEDGALTLDVEETYALLNKAFDLDSLLRLELDILGSINVINTTSFANAVMKGILSPDGAQNTDAQFNSLRISVDNFKLGEASSFNCKEAITHLPTDPTAARTYGGGKPLAFTGANPKATGRVFQTKESLGDIFTADGGIHIALEDLERLIGKNIEYTYTAIDGNTYTAKSQVVAIEGLDKTKLNQKQTVKAIVLPLDGQGGMLSDGLWKVLNAVYGFSLVGNNLPAHIALPIRGDVMDMDITLTEITSTVEDLVITTQCPESFELDPYEFNSDAKIDLSQYMQAQLTVRYSDGYSYVTDIMAISDNLIDGVYLVNDGREHSFTFSYYGIEFNTVNIVTTDPTATTIFENDRAIKVVTYGAEQGLKIKAVVKDGNRTTSKVIDPSNYRLLLDGKTLDEIELSSDGKQLFEFKEVKFDFKKDAPAVSKAYIFFSLEGKDGSEFEYSNTYTKLAQGAVWSYVSTSDNLGSRLDGKLTYNYWLKSDDEYAPVRTLTLVYEDGKYFMVDDVENPTVKIEAKLNAKNGTEVLTLTEDGMISQEDMMKLHFDAANKGTKSPKANISAEFVVDGDTVTTADRSVTFKTLLNFTYVKSVSNISSEKTFDDLVKFEVTIGGVKHEMRLKYVDGGYVLQDTYAGDEKIADIAVTVLANVATSSTGIGDAIELTDGMIAAEHVGKKVTLTFKFSYAGLDFAVANKISNKPVV